MTEMLRAFVIMPFEADLEGVYSSLIQVPLEEAGFEVTRADSLLNQRNILADVVTGIAHADLIVADVTGLNPNVMYELGLAHGLGKRTVMITQELETLPFDLRPYRANEYTTNFQTAHRLGELLSELGRAVADGTADFSNPVQDYAPLTLVSGAQVSLTPQRAPGSTQDAPATSGGDTSEDDDSHPALGFLDGLDVLQRGAETVNDISVKMGEKTAAIGESFKAGSSKLENIQKNLGGSKALQPSLALMRSLAKELDAYSDAMTFMNDQFGSALGEAASGANAVARYRQRPDTDLDTLRGEFISLEDLVKTLSGSYESTSSFAVTLSELPQVEGNLSKAAARASAIVAETASILESALAEFDRVRAIMRERLEEPEA